ncbi:MAG: N-acetyltransferase family protein [Bacteroidales bacterium]|jgi:L-amino acid N-acyltransferase YncA|nr:N-acetyltransferase family protein [Bacteroidales bacterium]MDD2264719.1 GNAT family N-acetyltransferase [Bacteroidales bacterium]MDD2832158.1 GNAT family N-acetyltransferase [Bacteroidales bacterium]MDD3209053.1 GNAT family N-acetyltransferase [Bacteroidales bacterium]MDD3697940.1 GNAT family N-acetyltransferase [Bacteroidales bacterium]
MNVTFETMSFEHKEAVMDIYNYYVNNSLAAYPDDVLPYEYYEKFLDMTKCYPAYVIKENDKIVGFCLLHAYNPFPTFKECAEISYFISPQHTGKGLGTKALKRLEEDALKVGIKTILANISSMNSRSIDFHKKNGFVECGRFQKIITKMGTPFDIIWMQKTLK